jgi:hypothetical protein
MSNPMQRITGRIARLLFFAAGAAVLSAGAAAQAVKPASAPPEPRLDVTVHTAFGGFILGYDIDESGTQGLLAEALTLPNGTHDVAVETFDQATGKILKVVVQELGSKNDYLALGITGDGVGLVEFEHVTTMFVDQRLYYTMDPIDDGAFTGRWTPPLTVSDIITSVARSQGLSTTAVLGFHNGGNFDTFVLPSDVAANTSGPLILVADPNFAANHAPVIALDSAHNQAILAALGPNPFGPPRLAKVNLATGAIGSFIGVGIGYVNGLAVDSSTGVACTSTEIDFRVEFYDLAAQTGFTVVLPGAVSQAHSGQDVQLDPIHKLFLVGQPISSTAPEGSSIQVFDEQGHFVESINGLKLPASPALIALNPSQRRGFVIRAPDLNELQPFSY